MTDSGVGNNRLIALDLTAQLLERGGELSSASGMATSLLNELINGLYGYSIDIEERDGLYVGQGILLTLGEEVAGCCVWRRDVAMDGSKLFFLHGGIVPTHRGRRLGSLLIEAALHELRVANSGASVIVALLSVPCDVGQSKYQPGSFWTDRGFRHGDTQVLSAGKTYDPGPENVDSEYRSRLHSIEDEASECEIIKLYNRMLGSRFGISLMTRGKLRNLLADGRSDCIVVERSSRVAGIAFVSIQPDHCYVDTIAIGREHWRNGVGDLMGQAIMRYASQKGAPQLTGMSAKSNAASLALMRRHGVVPLYETPRLSQTLV